MSMPVLLPLQCLQCQTPLMAEPDEVAWVCQTCGQAVRLEESQPSGLEKLEIQFSKSIQTGQIGRPFWVAQGEVSLERETYTGDDSRQALEFWQKPHSFFIPAYTCTLEDLITQGMRYLTEPVTMQAGDVCKFLPVTLALEDIRPMAEFIVMGLEAGRRDKLKTVRIQIKLAPASLWVLP